MLNLPLLVWVAISALALVAFVVTITARHVQPAPPTPTWNGVRGSYGTVVGSPQSEAGARLVMIIARGLIEEYENNPEQWDEAQQWQRDAAVRQARQIVKRILTAPL